MASSNDPSAKSDSAFFTGKWLLIVSFALVIISLLVYLGLYAFDDGGRIRDVRVSNLTANGATISWVTDDPAVGKVYYSDSDSWVPLMERLGKQVAYDDHDTEQSHTGSFGVNKDGLQERYLHHVTVRDLEPEKTYYFRVGESLRLFKGEDTEFSTLKVIEEIQTPDPVYGRVFPDNESDEGIANALVFYRVYRLDGEEEAASTKWYSSLLNENSGWTGDLALLTDPIGNIYNINNSMDLLEVVAVTRNYQAVRSYELVEYKPLPDLYLSDEDKNTALNPASPVFALEFSVSTAKAIENCCEIPGYTLPPHGACGDNEDLWRAGWYDYQEDGNCAGQAPPPPPPPQQQPGGSPPGQPTSTADEQCLASGCSRAEGQYWIGGTSDLCRQCRDGCTKAVSDTSIPACCDLMANSDSRRGRNGCAYSAPATHAPVPEEGTPAPLTGAEPADCNPCPGKDFPSGICSAKLVSGSWDALTRKAECTYRLSRRDFKLRYDLDENCNRADALDGGGSNINTGVSNACADLEKLPRPTPTVAIPVPETELTINQCYTDVGEQVCPERSCGDEKLQGKGFGQDTDIVYTCEYTTNIDGKEIHFYNSFQVGTDCENPILVNDGDRVDVCPLETGLTIEEGTDIASVLGAATGEEQDPGLYQVTRGGDVIGQVEIKEDNTLVRFFLDSNGDGVKQKSEQYIDSSEFDVKLSKVKDLVNYQLSAGWNLLGFELVSENYLKAADLVSGIRESGVNVTHVSIYVNGEWKVYSERFDSDGEIQQYGNNFNIVPGRGVFVKVESSGSFSFTGRKFSAPVPLDLIKGWNLVSVQSDKKHTATSLIDACEGDNISCDTVSRYESGRYESVVKDKGSFRTRGCDASCAAGWPAERG
ncbi:MAG: fibronectin type III domain-containing protein, partial [Candidatus Dojkabacteria bacterium]